MSVGPGASPSPAPESCKLSRRPSARPARPSDRCRRGTVMDGPVLSWCAGDARAGLGASPPVRLAGHRTDNSAGPGRIRTAAAAGGRTVTVRRRRSRLSLRAWRRRPRRRRAGGDSTLLSH